MSKDPPAEVIKDLIVYTLVLKGRAAKRVRLLMQAKGYPKAHEPITDLVLACSVQNLKDYYDGLQAGLQKGLRVGEGEGGKRDGTKQRERDPPPRPPQGAKAGAAKAAGRPGSQTAALKGRVQPTKQLPRRAAKRK